MIQATSSLVVVAASLVVPQQVTRTENPKPGATIRVLVVDDATGAPVGGATVTCTAVAALEAEIQRRGCGLERGFDPCERDTMRREFGTTLTADGDGAAEFARPAGDVRLMAVTDDHFGELRIAAGDDVPPLIRLAPEESLDVFVVDDHGKPVGGIPVTSAWTMEEPVDEGWPAGFDGVVISRESDGRARFPHAKGWRTQEWRMETLAFPVRPRAEIRLWLDPTGKPPELVVPPTGRVVLRFPGVEHGVAQIRNRVDDARHHPLWRDGRVRGARSARVPGGRRPDRRRGIETDREPVVRVLVHG